MASGYADWRGHVIVCGLRGVGLRIVEASSRIAEILTDAGLAGATAVICVQHDDLYTLETALLTRQLREDVRVVAQLGNPAVGRALSNDAEEYLSWLAVEKGRSRNTLTAYRRDIATYEAWASAEGVPVLSAGPGDLERYLAALRAGLTAGAVAAACANIVAATASKTSGNSPRL